MSEREILVADSDGKARKQLADCFSAAGYHVETTDSTAQLFCSVLEKQIPVVLLGSGCDKKIALADLVPMLKQCNKGVTIIVVSDEESLPVIRSVRQEGIFYHALKPTCRDDTEDILMAVECAFNKTERSGSRKGVRHAARQQAPEAAAVNQAETLVTLQAPEEPQAAAATVPSPEGLPAAVHTGTPRVSRYLEKNMRGHAAAILAALAGAVAGLACCVAAVARGMKEGADILIWAFLAFCSLIAVGQLLPAFFAARAARKVLERQLREGPVEQPAYGVSDKN